MIKISYKMLIIFSIFIFFTFTNIYSQEKINDDSNTNLRSLIIEGEYNLDKDFTPDTLNYNFEVPNDVTNLNIKANPENENSIVVISGADNLSVGVNLIQITVKAPLGNQKSYSLIVFRLGDGVTSSARIKNLKILNTDLSPSFDPNTLVYTCEQVSENTNELALEIELEDPNATYIVTRNDNFEPGENEVKITTYSQDNSNSNEYTIIVPKAGKLPTGKTSPKFNIAISVIILLIIAGIFIFLRKRARKI